MASRDLSPSASGPAPATHTPGPWRLVEDFDQIAGRTHRVYSVEGDVPTKAGSYAFLGLARIPADRGDAMLEANARLIAAAPDLLEEVREVCAILDRYRADTGEEPCFDHEAIGEEIARRHQSLTDALLKAEGKTNG